MLHDMKAPKNSFVHLWEVQPLFAEIMSCSFSSLFEVYVKNVLYVCQWQFYLLLYLYMYIHISPYIHFPSSVCNLSHLNFFMFSAFQGDSIFLSVCSCGQFYIYNKIEIKLNITVTTITVITCVIHKTFAFHMSYLYCAAT